MSNQFLSGVLLISQHAGSWRIFPAAAECHQWEIRLKQERSPMMVFKILRGKQAFTADAIGEGQ